MNTKSLTRSMLQSALVFSMLVGIPFVASADAQRSAVDPMNNAKIDEQRVDGVKPQTVDGRRMDGVYRTPDGRIVNEQDVRRMDGAYPTNDVRPVTNPNTNVNGDYRRDPMKDSLDDTNRGVGSTRIDRTEDSGRGIKKNP